MKRKLLIILLIGVIVIGITGCEKNLAKNSSSSKNNSTADTNSTNENSNEEVKTFNVGNYTLKYGYYKAGITTEGVGTLKLMEDGTCTYNAIDCTYVIEGNIINTTDTSETKSNGNVMFRVDKDNEVGRVASSDPNGKVYEVLPYYEVK